MSDAADIEEEPKAPTWAGLRREIGDNGWAPGRAFTIGRLDTLGHVRAAQARVVRKMTAGALELAAGLQIVKAMAHLLRPIQLQRQFELEDRKLAMLGGALDDGALRVFQGIAIIPPAQPPPGNGVVIEAAAIEPPAGGLEIKRPRKRKK